MASLLLKDVKKVYPNTEKKKKPKKGQPEQEKKVNLLVTEEGVVDLPHPDGPTSTMNSLSAISRLNS